MDYRTTYEPIQPEPEAPAASPHPHSTQVQVSRGAGEFKALLREVLETVLLTAVIFYAVNFTTGRYRIDGDSMEPTLHNGEYLILSKLTYKLDDPERGDVIVFRYPRNPERDFIKRIVGLPGDHVEVRDGGVYVNGARLSEDYILSAPLYESTWDVGASEYFVLGDNRNNSSDSHSWGLLPAENVIGKAWITYWPPTDWGIVPHVDFAVAATP